MPTLCIPRRKSILIETIHHSRESTDESFFFFDHGEEQLRTFMLGSLSSSKLKSIALARPPRRRPFVDPSFRWDSILPDFAEFRSNGRFWFISSPALCLCLPAFAFFLRTMELCAAGFASFRGIPDRSGRDTVRGLFDDIAFR